MVLPILGLWMSIDHLLFPLGGMSLMERQQVIAPTSAIPLTLAATAQNYMTIVTWNCNGGFRNKFVALARLNADIYVVQECEDPQQSTSESYQNWASNHLWIGDNKDKGLAIFARPEINLQRINWTNTYKDHTVKHFLPGSVDGKFNILGVWTHRNNSPNFGYMGQFWKYLQIHKNSLANTIIIGDFNSNSIWDEWDRWWNHSDVVKELNDMNIYSLYHSFAKEDHGKESQATFYMCRNLKRAYHIDYCFAPITFLKRLENVNVASFEDWQTLSDHVPMIFSFNS